MSELIGMSMRKKSVKEEEEMGFSDVGGGGKVVVVAVQASIEIPRTPLIWALTHVAQHGDCINLLLVLPAHSSGRRLWLSKFTSECTNGPRRSYLGTSSDQKDDITDMCTKMMLQLHNFYDPDKIKVKIKIVAGSSNGVVAAEARSAQSNWVILDRRLKHEKKCCMEELQCNVVVMKRSRPKVLRLNLVVSPEIKSEVVDRFPIELGASTEHLNTKFDMTNTIRGPPVTPTSSPDQGTPLTSTDAGTSSISSSDPGASPFLLSEIYGDRKKGYSFISEENWNLDGSDSDTDSEKPSIPATDLCLQPWWGDIPSSGGRHLSKFLEGGSQRSKSKALISTCQALLEKFSYSSKEVEVGVSNYRLDPALSTNVREVVSLSGNAPSASPPLCSICQHKAPMFGKPPRLFTYAELELATGRFSQANFLAEGGFGSVHRGVLPDGQVIAVKQYKLASSQGDVEFCSEVEVLSCAQHRNVVMLIGFCVEAGRRLLVYEYICNGSLDAHLYGRNRHPLEWSARQKIAIGAARGLRYLHEECRVGCIVHRDMRPNNILITHDFEPLVGDFGLARWQPDGDMGVETRVIGTFGYLAPEYAQSGQITEKADVYSFGVVLVELITGRKAMDINRPKGQQCLTEWARPLLERCAIEELLDPRIGNCYSEQDVYNMLHCASLCIRRDPHSRPRMSQVLRVLEGDIFVNSINYALNSGDNVGPNSPRMQLEQQERQQHRQCSGPIPSEAMAERLNRNLSCRSQRATQWERKM